MLTNMNTTLYYKHLEIDHKTLIKMKFVLNDKGVWLPKDQISVHAEEEHREEEEEKEKEEIGGDNEFINMFAMPPPTSSFKDVATSS